MKTINLLSEEERAAIQGAILIFGTRGCKDKAKLAAYLAEQNEAFPLRAYGHLLQAARYGCPVPQQLLSLYDQKTRAMEKDELQTDYEGAFMVGSELPDGSVEKIRMLCAAADSDGDTHGAAALKAADQLSCSVKLAQYSTYYYSLAKMRHNPDLLDCFKK